MSRSLHLSVVAIALVCLAASATPVPADLSCSRVVAVADQHGAYEGFEKILQATGVLDEQGNWSGGSACLVQLGDLLDRGPQSRDLLELLMRLERQAPDRVTVLMGNHEVMNVVGELDDTVAGEFTAFAGEETAEQREAGYETFSGMAAAAGRTEAERRQEFDRLYPPGWFAHRKAFSLEGRYGRWILERPVAARIGRTLFVHGGMSPSDAQQGMDGLRERVAGDIRGYLRSRERMEAAGLLTPLVPFRASFGVLRLQMEQAVEVDPTLAESDVYVEAAEHMGFQEASFRRQDGPLWHRDFAKGEGESVENDLANVLRILDVDRIVVGHSVQDGGSVSARFDDRVFAIDTGASPFYGGRPSALEIEGDAVRAVYLEGTEVLVAGSTGEGETAGSELPVSRSDDEIERFLREAEIVDIEEIGTGITKPRRATLRLDGRTARAAFKDADIQELNPQRFERSGNTLSFTDRYAYERAAYLLDRALGMGMVPVAVIRRVDGRTGALIDWVENAVSEADRRKRNLLPEDPRLLATQRSVMSVFDALILNEDRNLNNQLITTSDWKLHLIDHSRSFRLGKKLPESFAGSPVALTRDLHDALGRLNEADLRDEMDGLLSRAQIRSLLARRDRILEKTARDLEQYGEALVFVD